MIAWKHFSLALLAGFALSTTVVDAQGLKLRDICRVKGQEVNTLQGMGLVVGLKGTGDNDPATMKALARMMQKMGGQLSTDIRGNLMTEDIENAKNVAQVFVSAQVPDVGAQQGDRLDLVVNAISAKSIEGGYLMLTPLLGPRADKIEVYALAQGPLRINTGGPPTTATVHLGGKMETTVRVPFEKDGMLTLIIDRDYADFDTSQRLEQSINELPEFSLSSARGGGSPTGLSARAIDQLHVEVMIPELYRENPIAFISDLMSAPIALPTKSNRVVINEREQVVIIGENVEIAPALVTHQKLRIEAKGLGNFVEVDPLAPQGGNAKLKSLADALNALDVPTSDLIAIIKALKAKGDLYGEVIFQ